MCNMPVAGKRQGMQNVIIAHDISSLVDLLYIEKVLHW